MVFLVCSIVNPFNFILANSGTKDIQASQIFPLLWKVVEIYKFNSLKVITVTCDDDSANHKLFKMHFHLTFDDDINADVDVTYHTRNLLFLQAKQFVYFIFDVPNLLKTTQIVYIILVMVNTLYTCGKVACLCYGTILLIYFMKIMNVVLIFFPGLHMNTLNKYLIQL